MQLLHSGANEKLMLQILLPSLWVGACVALLWSGYLFLYSRGETTNHAAVGKLLGKTLLEKRFIYLFAGGVDWPEVTSFALGQ